MHLNYFCSSGDWTVIQRRVDGSESFARNWTEYKSGFGDPTGNYWAGLDTMHLATSCTPTRLEINGEIFDNDHFIISYETFRVGDELSQYELFLDGYSASDLLLIESFHENSGHNFTTYDMDNDDVLSENMAEYMSGG